MASIGVLGPLVVVGDDAAPIPLRGARPRRLLALLVARLGRAVAADELVEVLWGGDLPAHPGAALQSQVHRLRRQLGPAGVWVATEGSGYRLACAPEEVDAVRFEQLVATAKARSVEPDVALRELEEALRLWRGRAYADVGDHDELRVEAARLDELRAEAAEFRADLLLAAGRVSEAARAVEELAAEHPYRERPVAVRMRALGRQGRHVDALRAYDAFRRRLGEDLGLEPSPELRFLEGDLLRHSAPLPPAIGLPGNSFVGREVDLADAAALVERARLVTFTGPGGVGKTRLAAHVAARVASRFPDGIYRCELAPLRDPEAVTGAVASALQVEERTGRRLIDRAVEYLQPKEALLLLDNCEHVLDGASEVVASVLSGTPQVVVIATSRRRLGVEGEHVYFVRPLPVAGAGDDTAPPVTLFLDRAAAIRRDLDLSDDDRAAVRELCRRLDGLPLAVELAAARSRSRAPAEILAEVGERLDRLADTGRRLDRHRSMEAAMSWSYQLLGPVEQATFRQVSVFAGGWTAEAAAHLVDASASEADDALSSLVDHSLVTVATSSGRSRFAMLEPIRQFAEGRLGAEGRPDATRARHAAWAVRFIETADAGLRSADEAGWVAEMHAEVANLRAAHRWCVDHDPASAMRIVAALYWYAYWYGPPEVFAWADDTVVRFAASGDPHLPGAYATAAVGAWRRADFDRARALAQRGIELAAAAGDPASARFAWEALRSTELLAGHYERALACRDQAMALARVAGDVVHEAHAHAVGALALGYLGKADNAADELAVAAQLLATCDNPTTRALCDYVAGENRLDLAPREAIAFLQRSRDTARQVGNRFIASVAGLSAVSSAARLGDPTDILGDYAELIEYFHRAGAWTQLWTTIRTLIETLTRLGRDEPAALLYGALCATGTGAPVTGADAVRLNEAATTLRARLGDEAFTRLQGEGAALGDEPAADYALRLVGDRPSR